MRQALAECTFQPRTNNGARAPTKQPPEAFFTRSQQWAQQVAQTKEDKRKKAEGEKMADCTFSPQVTPRRRSTAPKPADENANRDQTSARRQSTGSVVSRLYQPQALAAAHETQERLREEQRQQAEAECSFQPVRARARTSRASSARATRSACT